MTLAAPDVAGPRNRRWILPATALSIFAVWLVTVETGGMVRPSPAVHTAALFVHLSAVVAGFGAVLVIDWIGLLWALGTRTFVDVTRTAEAVHVVIWGSLLALVASGVLLEPDASVPLTRIKLALVLVIALNGLYAAALQPQLTACGSRRPPPGLLAQAVVTATASQACWWAALTIGFTNSQS